MSYTGIHAFLDLLHDFGITKIFGNPGTTELPLNDALLHDSRFDYVLGLHEIPVVAMADGFTQATGEVACVNLHTACGLGNAMGMIYNAYQEGTPLLITAGQQDRRLRLSEPVLAGDLVSVARPWTKAAVEVQRVEDLPILLKRAVQTALTPPCGPVFVSLPLDVQMEPTQVPAASQFGLTRHELGVVPEAIEAAVAVLARSKNPVLLAGSRVQESNGVEAVERVAELWGMPVLYESAPSHGRLPISPSHPLAAGPLAIWSPDLAEQLKPYDTILACGINLFRLYLYFEPAWPLADDVSIVHLDSHAPELGKNHAPDVAIWADLNRGLHALETSSRSRVADLGDEIKTRREAHQHRIAVKREEDQRLFQAAASGESLTSEGMMQVVAEWAPETLAVVEEAVTSTHNALERLTALRHADGYFAHRGWALGWGAGLACGLQIAWPDRHVLAILGDGAVTYGLQALWTAASRKLPVTFLICQNQQYGILKDGADRLALPRAQQGEYLGMDLKAPELNFVDLARGFGVSGVEVATVAELRQALKERCQATAPGLIAARLTPSRPRP